jgi:glutamine cyclotransferase
MNKSAAEVIREYGPFPGIEAVHGVTYDGEHVWFASDGKLNALDPQSGKIVRSIEVPAHAGTAFDGKYLYQLADTRIQKIDPETGKVLSTIPAPEGGASGLAWAEGSLWVGRYRNRRIDQIDPETGATLRSIDSNRHVTGVTWIGSELWHATLENDQSEIRHVDTASGKVLETVEMPAGALISGMESNGKDEFYCGGAKSGKVRAVRKPAPK